MSKDPKNRGTFEERKKEILFVLQIVLIESLNEIIAEYSRELFYNKKVAQINLSLDNSYQRSIIKCFPDGRIVVCIYSDDSLYIKVYSTKRKLLYEIANHNLRYDPQIELIGNNKIIVISGKRVKNIICPYYTLYDSISSQMLGSQCVEVDADFIIKGTKTIVFEMENGNLIIRHTRFDFDHKITWKFPYNKDIMLKCDPALSRCIQILPYINNMYILSGLTNTSIRDIEGIICRKIPGISISNPKLVLKDGAIIYEEIKDYLGANTTYCVLSFYNFTSDKIIKKMYTFYG